MSFGQQFLDNLLQAHATGVIPDALRDALADDVQWQSLSKSSLGNQARGKAAWLAYIEGDRGEYSASLVYENDEVIVWKGNGDHNGVPQAFLFVMQLENGRIKHAQHVRGIAG